MTVGELRKALAEYRDDQVVVLDVDLDDCNSDRNILDIRVVGNFHPETGFVFLDGMPLESVPDDEK